jgi:hypothetical protein
MKKVPQDTSDVSSLIGVRSYRIFHDLWSIQCTSDGIEILSLFTLMLYFRPRSGMYKSHLDLCSMQSSSCANGDIVMTSARGVD